MKISKKNGSFNKLHLNHSSDIDFLEVMNFCKTCTKKPCTMLVIGTNHASDNPLCLRKNIPEKL